MEKDSVIATKSTNMRIIRKLRNGAVFFESPAFETDRVKMSSCNSEASSCDVLATTPCSRCEAYAMERHRRIELENRLRLVELERDTYLKVAPRVIRELDMASDALSRHQTLTSELEAMSERMKMIEDSLMELGELAHTYAQNLHQKATVAKVCAKSGTLIGPMVRLASITGLPRLRVFSDEDCFIHLSIHHVDTTELWLSKPIIVKELPGLPGIWESGIGDETVNIPLGLFSCIPESRFRLVLDSVVIGETKLVSSKDILSRSRIELYHDDVQLPDAFLSFHSDSHPSSLFEEPITKVDIRILSVSNVLLDVDDDRTEGNSNPIVISFRCSQSIKEEVISLDPNTGTIPALTLDMLPSFNGKLESDVQLSVGGTQIARGSMSMGMDETIISTHEVPLFTDDRHNGSITLESNIRTKQAHCRNLVTPRDG